jgi:excisionase family DNA binding protein
MTTHTDPLVYSIRQVADMLSVNQMTVRRMLADGELTEVRVRRSIRIPREEIARILASVSNAKP